MKQLITTLILTSLVSVASAASFKWTTDQVSFGSTKVGANATGYLVFLGNHTFGDEGYEWADIIEMDSVADAATKVSKMNVPSVEIGTNAGNYVMYMTYTSDNKTYYNVASGVHSVSASQISGAINDGIALDGANFTLASTINDATATPTIGDGWFLKPTTPDPGPTPGVPEPATGALALVGVALLFKRRRA